MRRKRDPWITSHLTGKYSPNPAINDLVKSLIEIYVLKQNYLHRREVVNERDIKGSDIFAL